MAGPRYKVTDGVTVCEDCGVVVAIPEAHTRFHSILSAHAWALAVLKTRHGAAHMHNRYDVVERIDSKRFDSWSADALAEVIGHHGADPPGLPALGTQRVDGSARLWPSPPRRAGAPPGPVPAR